MTNIETNAKCLPAQATIVENTDVELGGAPKPFSKHISRDANGKLVKTTRAQIVQAQARRIKFNNLRELAGHIIGAPGHVALVHGITATENAEIVTKHTLTTADLRDSATVKAARSKDFFGWPQDAAVLQLDYDPEDGKPPLTPEKWLKIVREACPELRGVQIMIVPSVSTFIYDELEDELAGAGGFRAYIIIDKGAESRRVGVSIAIRLIEAGHGFIKFGRDGKAHVRTLIDVAVFSPERPNFIGAASLEPGLSQKKREAQFTKGNPILAVADVPDRGDYKQFLKRSPIVAALRGKAEPEERERRQAYASRREKETGIPAEKWVRATTEGVLPRNTYIECANGRGATLEEIEANPVPYQDQYCRDPIEPEEGSSRAIIRVRIGGEVIVYSFLHGGCEYRMASLTEGLAERIAQEGAGAAYEPEMLKALAQLQRRDPGAWQTLRADIKHIPGKPLAIADLDKAVKAKVGEVLAESGEAPEGDAEILIRLGGDADYFRSPLDEVYADIPVQGHIETVPADGSRFREWLLARFYSETKRAPGRDAPSQAISTLIARERDGKLPMRELCRRVRREGEKIYYDLADDDRRVIEIDRHGWRVISELPDEFRFVRSKGMAPAPMPVAGNDTRHAKLRALLNVRGADDFVLVLGWLLNALAGRGPYLAAIMTGEAGACKSSMVRFLQRIADPSTIDIRPPRFGEDLYLAGTKSHLLAYDNVSSLTKEESDDFARVATGTSFTTRKFYTQDDETVMTVKNPLVCNGISDFVTRGDLADRSVAVELFRVTDDDRAPEWEIRDRWAADIPHILGSVFDEMAQGLANEGRIERKPLKRMADASEFIQYCEAGRVGADRPEFAVVLGRNLTRATTTIVEGDPIARAVLSHMQGRGTEPWEGSAKELLSLLPRTEFGRFWPDSEKALINALRRAATPLRQSIHRLHIEFGVDRRKRGGGQNDLTISRLPTLTAEEMLEGVDECL